LCLCDSKEVHVGSECLQQPQELEQCASSFPVVTAGKMSVAALADFGAIRTHFIDQQVLKSVEGGIRQVVCLGAGLDTRAYRLGLPSDVKFFEVDFEASLKFKQETFDNWLSPKGERGAKPSCKRVAVAVNLLDTTDDGKFKWLEELTKNGFSASKPSVVIMEGLIQYFKEADAKRLLGSVQSATASGSVLLVTTLKGGNDTRLKSMLDQFKNKFSTEILFFTDDPKSLVESVGFTLKSTATVKDLYAVFDAADRLTDSHGKSVVGPTHEQYTFNVAVRN